MQITNVGYESLPQSGYCLHMAAGVHCGAGHAM
jgi:hypothetical protein